jgi:hypothetical protein
MIFLFRKKWFKKPGEVEAIAKATAELGSRIAESKITFEQLAAWPLGPRI